MSKGKHRIKTRNLLAAFGPRAWHWPWLVALVVMGGCARPGTAAVDNGVTTPAGTSSRQQPTSAQLPVRPDDIVWGVATAPVTIVAFLDFECPFCAQVHDTLLELLSSYGPTKVRLVVKHAPLPFHQRGRPAASAAQAVYRLKGGAAFLEYVKLVFDHPDSLDDETLVAWASELGMSAEQFRSEMASAPVQSKVAEDLELAEAVGVNGVPAFYVNGANIIGARPKADFVSLIEHELRAGEELLRRGVAPDGIYAERVAVNWASQPAEPKPYEDIAFRVPVGDSPVQGPVSAPITIIEFADFECPFCEQAHNTIASLMARYPNQIRWAMKHNPLPFHPLAVPAAITALEVRKRAGEAAYWRALQHIYAASSLSREVLKDVAEEFGISQQELERSWTAVPPALQADQDLAMDLGAMGTPHFFINGRRLAGAQPLGVFEEVIQQELQKVAALGNVPEPYTALQRSALPPSGLRKHDVPAPNSNSPTLGDVNAPVVIQMFADFECAYCIRVLPTLAALRAKYTGKIKLVWRHLPLPFHPNARRAAAAAIEAQTQLGPEGFWRMAEKLVGYPNAFTASVNSPDVQTQAPTLTHEALISAARELGLDERRFADALETGVHETVIRSDQEVARRLGVQGTPAFFVGAYSLDGAQPLAKFDRLVRMVLEEVN